ncbi:MAG: O-antigen ligase family protein [Planctomycetota bacterium]|nr:O-antigen ligase family protein [Planctomycetota bacterium]
MMDGSSDRSAGPRWLPWICLGLLALPFHPLWVDFEQVRRGLLLVLVGALLCALPRLPRARGVGVGAAFVSALALSAAWHWISSALTQSADTTSSFQPWEAAYRVAHWLSLVVMMRVGALSSAAAMAAPVATLLLATSAFGVLQRLGCAEISGYGVEREPVSTLGNLNVASEWTAVATAATAALLRRCGRQSRWLAIAALLCAGAYLVINPSRSGKVATAGALGAMALLQLRESGWLKVAAGAALTLAAGGVLGLFAAWTSPALPPDVATSEQTLQRSTVTLQVRFEIADGVGELLREAPVFGHGPGMFQVEYPRHRNQEEIEASSFGRQFSTMPRNAHNDWLELLVDGGPPALLLFVWMLYRLARRGRDLELLLPLFALTLMMFVRAPTLNAPAAALAFWLAGAASARQGPAELQPGRRGLAFFVGAGLISLGVLPIAANTAATPYLAARRLGEPAPPSAAAAAAAWMPFEPRWRQLEAREALNRGDLQRAAHLAATALELRPHSPPLLLLMAEVLARGSRYGEAIQVARSGLELDPANPELRALISVALAELGDVERAIREVVVAPHPVLRSGLAQHFLDLADRAIDRGERTQASRYLIEQMFLAIAESSGGDDADSIQMVGFLQLRLQEELQRCERSEEDLRWLFTGALAALDADRDDLADSFAAAAEKKRARLEDWQADLLGGQLERLRARPAWRALLPR